MPLDPTLVDRFVSAASGQNVSYAVPGGPAGSAPVVRIGVVASLDSVNNVALCTVAGGTTQVPVAVLNGEWPGVGNKVAILAVGQSYFLLGALGVSAGSGVELGKAELSASPAAVTTTLADVAGLTVTFNAPARAFILDLTVPYISASASTVQLALQITDSSNAVIAEAFTGAGTSWSATTVPPFLLRCRLPKVGGTAPYAITPGTSHTFKVRGQTTTGTATITDFADLTRPILRAVTC